METSNIRLNELKDDAQLLKHSVDHRVRNIIIPDQQKFNQYIKDTILTTETEEGEEVTLKDHQDREITSPIIIEAIHETYKNITESIDVLNQAEVNQIPHLVENLSNEIEDLDTFVNNCTEINTIMRRIQTIVQHLFPQTISYNNYSAA